MDRYAFSARTRECLARAGWTPGYVAVELDAYVAALEAEGYEVHEAARAFLRSFGGLLIRFPHARVEGYMDSVSTRADVAASRTFTETAEGWGGVVGARVCLVGEVYGGYMGLAMDPAGRVFAGEGLLVLQLGDSGADAIEGLCTVREPVVIQDPTKDIWAIREMD